MNIKEKNIPITSVELIKKLDSKQEVALDVHFNAWGEVLKIEHDELDLPDAAKLMIHGKILNPELRANTVLIRELKHIIPMMASGLIETSDVPTWLMPIDEALKEMQSENVTTVELDKIKDAWTRAFYASTQKEKYRYFFKLFTTDKNNRPPVEQVLEQLDTVVLERIFVSQLHEDDDFAKTYLMSMILQASDAFYTEEMDWQSNFSDLEVLIDYAKVGLDMKDRTLMRWLHDNRDLPFLKNFDDFKLNDEVLNILFNTYVQKLINGTRRV